MKKFIIIAAALLLTLGANAQVFIGGSFGLSVNSQDENGSLTDYSSFAFNFMPKIGYFFNSKIAAGLNVSLGISGSSGLSAANNDVESSSLQLGIAPFVRYYALAFGKFNVGIEGVVGGTFGSSTTKTGTVERKGPKTTAFSINFKPMVSYDLSEHVSLEAYLGFLNLSLSSTSSKPEGGKRVQSTAFHFGANADNVFTTGNIQVGAVFKF